MFHVFETSFKLNKCIKPIEGITPWAQTHRQLQCSYLNGTDLIKHNKGNERHRDRVIHTHFRLKKIELV